MKSDVTLRQIANELDLSAMTVSRAINDRSNVNEKTKERVLEKAQNMGYTLNHVAKSLVSNKTFTIGLVVPEITHAFFQSPLTTIQQPAYQLGKRATKKLIQTIDNEHELVENIEVSTTLKYENPVVAAYMMMQKFEIFCLLSSVSDSEISTYIL